MSGNGELEKALSEAGLGRIEEDKTVEVQDKKGTSFESPLETIKKGYSEIAEKYNNSSTSAKFMTWLMIPVLIGGLVYLKKTVDDIDTSIIKQKRIEYQQEIRRDR